MKVKLMFYFLLLYFSVSAQQYSFIVSNAANNSINIEFKSLSKKQDIILGGGISYFYNKGNKGKDYSLFVADLSGTYETIIAKEGSIFFVVGNKISNSLSCTFRFGMGSIIKYTNGIGLPTLPNERWYTRQRVTEDLLCGLNFQYNTGHLSLSCGWDSFNSFNAGIGFNFKSNNK
jgi:hypothetical protein